MKLNKVEGGGELIFGILPDRVKTLENNCTSILQKNIKPVSGGIAIEIKAEELLCELAEPCETTEEVALAIFIFFDKVRAAKEKAEILFSGEDNPLAIIGTLMKLKEKLKERLEKDKPKTEE